MVYVSKIDYSWREVKPMYKGIQYESMSQFMDINAQTLGISAQEVFDRMTFFGEHWARAILIPPGSSRFYWEYESRKYPTLDALAKEFHIDSMELRRSLMADGNLIACVRKLLRWDATELLHPFMFEGRYYRTLSEVRRDFHTTYADECNLLSGKLKMPVIRLGSEQFRSIEAARAKYEIPEYLFKLCWESGFPLDSCLFYEGIDSKGIHYPSLHKFLIANYILPEHIAYHAEQLYNERKRNLVTTKYLTSKQVLNEIIAFLEKYQQCAWEPKPYYPMEVAGCKVQSLIEVSKILHIRKRILENRLLNKCSVSEFLAPVDPEQLLAEAPFQVSGKPYASVAAVSRDFGLPAYLINKYKTGPDLTEAVIAARRDKATLDEKARNIAIKNAFFEKHRIVSMALYGDTTFGGDIYKVKFEDDPAWYLHTLETLEHHWDENGIRIPLYD